MYIVWSYNEKLLNNKKPKITGYPAIWMNFTDIMLSETVIYRRIRYLLWEVYFYQVLWQLKLKYGTKNNKWGGFGRMPGKRHVGPFCVDKMALDLNFYANGFVKTYWILANHLYCLWFINFTSKWKL